jgi:pimeloyl-ACP methyl ester carboxylesterase
MATFVLLHGSFHAAWNWHKTVPYITKAGHRSVSLNLLGHGLDTTPPHKVTLSAGVKQVLDVVAEQEGPVVLVAHSGNGVLISQAAEERPNEIAGLVYLTAYLVPTGKSAIDYALHEGESVVAQNLEMSVGRYAFRFKPSHFKWAQMLMKTSIARWLLRWTLPRSLQSHSLRYEAYREGLYHDCADEITELANGLIEPEPHWSRFTPLHLTPERYGRVAKVYIECLQDRALTLETQRRMQRDTPCDKVYSLDSSHSPFFSQPEELAATLIESLSTFPTQPRGATK